MPQAVDIMLRLAINSIGENPDTSIKDDSNSNLSVEGLSGCWNMFTKCKDYVDGGFRLENMTWRLWSRKLNNERQVYSKFDTDSIPNIPVTNKIISSDHDANSSISNAFLSRKHFETLLRSLSNAATVSTLINQNSTDHAKAQPQPPNDEAQNATAHNSYAKPSIKITSDSTSVTDTSSNEADTSIREDNPKETLQIITTNITSTSSSIAPPSPNSAANKGLPFQVKGFKPEKSDTNPIFFIQNTPSDLASTTPSPVISRKTSEERSLCRTTSPPHSASSAPNSIHENNDSINADISQNAFPKTRITPAQPIQNKISFVPEENDKDEPEASTCQTINEYEDVDEDWSSVSSSSPTELSFGREQEPPAGSLYTQQSMLSALLLKREAEIKYLREAREKAERDHAQQVCGPGRPHVTSYHAKQQQQQQEQNQQPSSLEQHHHHHGLNNDIALSESLRMSSASDFVYGQSPRTTRRRMLATELSESLRRNLLWERQQKSIASTAHLKRRNTSTPAVATAFHSNSSATNLTTDNIVANQSIPLHRAVSTVGTSDSTYGYYNNSNTSNSSSNLTNVCGSSGMSMSEMLDNLKYNRQDCKLYFRDENEYHCSGW